MDDVSRVSAQVLQMSPRKLQDSTVTVTPAPALEHFERKEHSQRKAEWHLDSLDNRKGNEDGKFFYSLDGAGVDIYIMDSGIDDANTEFTGRVSPGINFDPDQPEDDTTDCNGHGA